MEGIRKNMMTNGDVLGLFPAKSKAPPSRTKPLMNVIEISSTEASPVSARSSDFSSQENDVDARDRLQNIVRHAHPVILSDGEDDDVTPIQRPATTKSHSTKSTSKGVVSEPIAFKKPPSTIAIPQNIGSSTPRGPSDGPVWETFAEPDLDNLYDPVTSSADAEHALQDLLAQSMNEVNEEIDTQLAEVKGFREGIKLLPHQVVGRLWMKERESGKKLGGILADDMGLGKTIQTLTRIMDGRPRKGDKDSGFCATTLVVCPVGLMSQWASEIEKMAVGLRVIEHHGPSRTNNPESLKRAHVVVTSYSVLVSEYGSHQKQEIEKAAAKKSKSKKSKDMSDSDDSDAESSSGLGHSLVKKKTAAKKPKKILDALFNINWWRIVLDEAHNIKNRTTKQALACCALEGKFRWCLTGTPMQNNVEELYSLLKFLRIRPLNDWETFNNQINKPVKSGRSVRAMKRLQVVLKAIMLRRRKDTILNGKPLINLPPRIVNVNTCMFGSDEREFYEAIQSKVELTLNKFMKNGDMMKNYTSMLVLLLRLRQACNHPSLISKDFTDDKDAVEPRASKDDDEADELADLFGAMGVSGTRKCQMCQNILTPNNTSNRDATYCTDCEELTNRARRKSLAAAAESVPPESAKIRETMRLLNDIIERSNGEEKTIVFSQFTSMLDLIQPFLRRDGIKYVRYDGSMKKDQREESLEKIRNDKSVNCILISFKAGNTGLNLTACNNVILVDMWWNPALEDQAFDRAHRFGQTRQVNIYKLTIENTVEERILSLQEKKRLLAAAALSGDKIKNSKLGLNDLMDLFRHGGQDDED